MENDLNKLIICTSTVGPKYNLVKIGQAVSEKKTFKDYEILYMYIAQGQGQITPGDKIFVVTKNVCYFDYFDLPYMGMAVILINGPRLFVQIFNTH